MVKAGHYKLKSCQKHLFLASYPFGLLLAACRSPVGPRSGVQASIWAVLVYGNHKKWVVAGGLGALKIAF